MKGNRTNHHRQYDREDILAKFAEYIAKNDIPILREFATQVGINHQVLYEWEEAKEPLALCMQKKEAGLERQGLSGKVALPMAIFSLKQLGWSDRQETTHKGDANAPVTLNLVGSDVHG